MPGKIDLFDTISLIAINEEIVPPALFFRDRYFPTGAGDIFKSEKVFTEYRKGDRKMAAFVSDRVGDIPMDRRGFDIHEYEPARIAPSRVMTVDDLKKRGFGEALFSDMAPAKRALKLQMQDLEDIDARISRREEWMAVQTMINNGCTIQEYIDDATEGEEKHIYFYDGPTSEHTYTVSTKWDAEGGDIKADVKAMCRMLTKRGLKAADLILGSDAADVFEADPVLRAEMDRNSNINRGGIDETLTKYDGVIHMGRVNFGGCWLEVFSVDETYTDENDQTQSFFPAKSAMVTAPACGHMMYAQVTQIDFGSKDYATYTGKRVPRFSVDQENDIRKLRITARPLAAPNAYCPWIYAENVVGAEDSDDD